VEIVLAKPADWDPPAEYLAKSVADKVVKIVLGYLYK